MPPTAAPSPEDPGHERWPAYPDASVDMFYTLPWIKLKATGKYANCADQPHQFAGQSWQR